MVAPKKKLSPEISPPVDTAAAKLQELGTSPTPIIESGGSVGALQAEIERRFFATSDPTPAELWIETASRWSGPATLIVAIACLVYFAIAS